MNRRVLIAVCWLFVFVSAHQAAMGASLHEVDDPDTPRQLRELPDKAAARIFSVLLDR